MTQLTEQEKEIQHMVEMFSINTDIFLAVIALRNDGDGRLGAQMGKQIG